MAIIIPHSDHDMIQEESYEHPMRPLEMVCHISPSSPSSPSTPLDFEWNNNSFRGGKSGLAGESVSEEYTIVQSRNNLVKSEAPKLTKKKSPKKLVNNNISVSSSNDIPASIPQGKQYLYKTELCRSWMESRTCKYADKCQFAHGWNELRPVNRHPKYKTEICKAFHDNGFCPYGARCQFIHCLRNETQSNTNFKRGTYAYDLEHIEIWHTRDSDCLCVKRNRPRLPIFENSIEDKTEFEHESSNDASTDSVRQYGSKSPRIEGDPSTLFSDEQSSDSSF